MNIERLVKNILKLILFFAVISVLLVALFREQWMKKRELEREIVLLETELRSIEKENETLEKEIKDSDSLQFVEKVAREEYGLVKPGEIIYIDINR